MTPGAALLQSVLAPRFLTLLALAVAAVTIAALIFSVLSIVPGTLHLAPTRWDLISPIA